MNCRSVESLFSSYIEDEISQEERRTLEAHLMGCRRCSLAMREVRATMSLLERMPEVAPSAHFDEDVFARIRSGEGLRPSAAELIRELLVPARLRPVFMAGAGVCAVFLAVLVSPVGNDWLRSNHTAPPSSASRPQEPATVAQVAPDVSSPSASISTEPSVPSPGRATPAQRRTSVVASASEPTSAGRDSIVDGGIPRQLYNDEIINDQFYIERGRQGQDPTVVPVSGTADDGVYIVF
ncbi:MAG TPA: zf-HC2 domain-containing protein [Candidatus Eisenbacteria bacterium]